MPHISLVSHVPTYMYMDKEGIHPTLFWQIPVLPPPTPLGNFSESSIGYPVIISSQHIVYSCAGRPVSAFATGKNILLSSCTKFSYNLLNYRIARYFRGVEILFFDQYWSNSTHDNNFHELNIRGMALYHEIH